MAGGSLALMSDLVVPPIRGFEGTGPDNRMDIYNRLLRNRIVVLGTDVNDDIANMIAAQLLYLEGEDADQGHLAVHQLAGRLGHRGHGHLRHHAVRQLRRGHDLHGPGRLDGPVPARRRRQGQALLAAPRPDHDAPALGRAAGPGGRHRHPGRADGLHEELLAELIAQHTGQTVEQVTADSDRDRWFSAEQAKDYGIIDHVIVKRGEII